jgi:DNA-binding response OmpR family regulator
MTLSAESRVEFNPVVAWNAGRTLIRRARRILVVDSDLGFALWLSATLVNVGYAAFPAAGFQTALSMAQRLVDGLDLLVLNPQVKQAADLISTLHRYQPRLKVVALVAGDEAGALPFVDAYLCKPLDSEREVMAIIQAIDQILTVDQAA